MLFNSFEFLLFLPIVFLLYWFVFNKGLRLQNAFLLLASYVFYGWWDWRFLSLIIFSSLVDYLVGIYLHQARSQRNRKLLLGLSLLVNLGLLGVFKYYNFFIDSLLDLNPGLETVLGQTTINIILPVGISFYTFQTLSYSIDIYRRNLEPTKDIVAFFAFVSFFPQLVAGPIERASNLLPQFYRSRKFSASMAADGLRQMLWGLFKKVIIADNCATLVNQIFDGSESYSSGALVLGSVLFAFQIYGDFSGYSDIAIGVARLFGFNLMRNFAFPYFSRDIAEFWRRWHISLSTWFRDYLYIPLGGSRGRLSRKIRNTMIVFVVSGFWHGANWTFIVWGFLNALYFLPLLLLKRNRVNTDTVAEGGLFPSIREVVQMLVTFSLTCLAWIFFRAESVGDALLYIKHIFEFRTGTALLDASQLYLAISGIGLLLFVEWIQRTQEHGLEFRGIRIPVLARWGIYTLLTFIILIFFGSHQNFIYFQF